MARPALADTGGLPEGSSFPGSRLRAVARPEASPVAVSPGARAAAAGRSSDGDPDDPAASGRSPRRSDGGVDGGPGEPPAQTGPARAEDKPDNPPESLARRLARAGDRVDQVVCMYLVECFEDVVQKAVARFDRRLDRAVRTPAADVPARVAEELDRSRSEFRRDLADTSQSVLQEVREALGAEYRLGDGASAVHPPIPRGPDPGSAQVEAAREQFRRDLEDERGAAAAAVRDALGGGHRVQAVSGPALHPAASVEAPSRSGSAGAAPTAPDAADPVDAGSGPVEAREARAELVGSPRAVVVGHLTQAGLMVAAARGPAALCAMAERIDRSPLRQAGLETVGADPVLLRVASDAHRGSRPVEESPIEHLASDLAARHLARCRDDPELADRDERRFSRTRAALRSGPLARHADAAEQPLAAVSRVEIDSRLGRVPDRLPPEKDLGGRKLSLEGRAWVDRMRRSGVVPDAAGADAVVVPGSARGPVRSLLGRRAQGFDRVLQLAETRRGALAQAVSTRLLRWGTSGGSARLKAVGLVLGGSKHLMAGLLRGGADAVAVAAASSRGAARAVATGHAGAGSPLVDGARSSDHRRLVQVAHELDRRERRAELTGATAEEARLQRLDRWSEYRARRGPVAALLKELHGERYQVLTERRLRERDRAADARRTGDKDFDLVRERVRDRGVKVWAQGWEGRGSQAFDGREWRFDGARTHPDGVPPRGSVADGVKAMLALAGARVGHGDDHRLHVSKDLDVRVPQGLNDEQRQSALIYGAAKAVVVGRNPALAAGPEAVVLSGMLASSMARQLDATYRPPPETQAVDASRVADEVLRKGNAIVQDVGMEVRRRLEAGLAEEDAERGREVDRQVDFVARHSHAERPRREDAAAPAAERGVGPAARSAVVDPGPGRG